MTSFALIFLFAIGIVLGSFALCTFLVGITRYLQDDPARISEDFSLLQCQEYRPATNELKHAHASVPWHG